jgi:murein L,D-transpeptidase YcbB/YkuD
MGWFTNWMERMAGLDPAKVNPALPAIRRLIDDIKVLEPDIKALEALWFGKIQPTVNKMRPTIDAAMREWDVIAPAMQQVMDVIGVHGSVGQSPQQATAQVKQALVLARPEVNVKWMQAALNQLGYHCGAPDGIYGRRTVDAVRAYQQASGLKVDGWPGPKTMSALHGDLSPGVTR